MNSILKFIAFIALFHIGHGYRVSVGFECPYDGIFADPENCQDFYQCANSFPYHQSCPEGDFFDEDLKICNFEEEVDCGSRPPPPGHSTKTSTVPSTTTPFTDSTTDITVSTISTTTVSPETTSTTESTTTTTHRPGSLPDKILGMYILLADETEEGYDDDAIWQPRLYEYQQQGSNVLFFTFIHPGRMQIPEAFKTLAATRGTGAPGAVPADTKIIFAIGGYLYSINPNPWPWLTSQSAAEAMAEKVANWPDLYGCDGIDLDLEEGAGAHPEAGSNMIHFVRRLRELRPDMIITQPVYGYPQVQAQTDVVNAAWTASGNSNGLVDTVGLMVYEGAQSINYIDNYAHGTDQWEGFPIKVDVTISDVVLGCKGSASAHTIEVLADESLSRNLRGIMVWYASVMNGNEIGLQYEKSWDASIVDSSKQAYIDAMKQLNNGI